VLKVLDLFSGIGGFSLGLERAGMETVAFCEIEEYPGKVLNKHWPDVPIYNDIKTLTKERLNEDGIKDIELICGGFPCQPFSTAGNQLAEEDHRHLWPEMLRVITELKPNWVIGENVPGIIGLGLDSVLASLEAEGYSTRTFIIPACAVNAPHRRDRVWIVGNAKDVHSNGGNDNKRKSAGQKSKFGSSGGETFFSDSKRGEREMGREAGRTRGEWESFPWDGSWTDEVKPVLDRANDGLPNRLDRLKGLGNAVVPQIPELIGRAIMSVANEKL
jgi:DNA (cytosine-5)-methyltransferase 1